MSTFGTAKTSSSVSSSSVGLVESICCSFGGSPGLPTSLDVTITGDPEWSGSVSYIGITAGNFKTWEASFDYGGNGWIIQIILAETENGQECLLLYILRCLEDGNPAVNGPASNVFDCVFSCDSYDCTVARTYDFVICGTKSFTVNVQW